MGVERSPLIRLTLLKNDLLLQIDMLYDYLLYMRYICIYGYVIGNTLYSFNGNSEYDISCYGKAFNAKSGYFLLRQLKNGTFGVLRFIPYWRREYSVWELIIFTFCIEYKRVLVLFGFVSRHAVMYPFLFFLPSHVAIYCWGFSKIIHYLFPICNKVVGRFVLSKIRDKCLIDKMLY